MTDTTSSATPGGMDFSESSELGLVKSQIDRFIEREVRPLESEHDQFLGGTGRGEPTGRERLPCRRIPRHPGRDTPALRGGWLPYDAHARVGRWWRIESPRTLLVLEHVNSYHPEGFHEMLLETLLTPALLPMHEDDHLRERYFESR